MFQSLQSKTKINVRLMTEIDLDYVRKIEHEAYDTDFWSRRTFEEELVNGFSEYLIAEIVDDKQKGQILGFAGVWFMKDQLHLVTLAVLPACQKIGIGSILLLNCFGLAISADMQSIVLEVRESNIAAQNLYKRFGFKKIGKLSKYYRDNDEDAIVMATQSLDSMVIKSLLREWHLIFCL